MLNGILQAAGGLGLFLLGMSVMTDGLKSMADDRLRSTLAKTTRSPFSGVCTGAVATAILQSSSATTVAAVGFVHAGLLTFPQALGIIFGANIGTTLKGWLIAFLGFKMQLGQVLLPVIFVGMLLRLAGRGRVESTGTALAGFGLIFVGIDVLQAGMTAFQGILTPESFPSDTISGRLLLVLIGVAFTIVTQSSSAGVAAALTAVHTETITLNQAAAMVIGMDLGTTVTAAMATIGGNIQARRTGLAHVIYNAMTAIGAFLILTPFLVGVDLAIPGASITEPELVLVGFHTFFNTLGVLAILPFTRQFATLIIRLFPERGSPLVRRLDVSLLDSPEIALQAVRATLRDLTQSVFAELVRRIDTPEDQLESRCLNDAEQAIEKSRDYLQQLRIDSQNFEGVAEYLRCVHILDHLRRVHTRVGNTHRLKHVRADAELSQMTNELFSTVEILLATDVFVSPEQAAELQEFYDRLKQTIRSYRRLTMCRTAEGEIDTRTALKRMDTARWLQRLVRHVLRIAHHSIDQSPSVGDNE
jgi:phosphate:Na+ symporter